jgi:hypothetical protein
MAGDDFPTRLAAATGDGDDAQDADLPSASAVVAGLLRPLRGADRSAGGERYEADTVDRSAGRYSFTADVTFRGVDCESRLAVFRKDRYVYAVHGLEPSSSGGLLSRLRGSDSTYDTFDVPASAVADLEQRRRELVSSTVVDRLVAVRSADGPGGFTLRFETAASSMLAAESFTDGRDYVRSPLPDVALAVLGEERDALD